MVGEEPTVQQMVEAALGRRLPPPLAATGLEDGVREAVAASGRTVVALDDDPTGVQTVHDVAVLAGWAEETLRSELARRAPLFFILTNSRSLSGERAAALNREVARNLLAASAATGQPFVIASRSDSTLRGHYPAETDALASELGGVDGVIVCPAFCEGGRVTAGDIHFVREGDTVLPAAATEFARDATFGYRAETLPQWIAEKSGGRIPAADVASLSLEEIRGGGPRQVAARLRAVRDGQPVVVNALDYADLWQVVLGLLQVEAEGKRFLYRCGASFVRARAGSDARPLLRRGDLLGADAPVPARGLVVVGSHVRRSSEQLARLLTLPLVVGSEVAVSALLGGEAERVREIARVTDEADGALRQGRTPVVYTSRQVERPSGMAELDVAQIVSSALVAIVQGVRQRPDFIIGKGGITSSDVGTRGLEARRPLVAGQILPGVPVWRLGAESRFPGLPYVVFPGNVGGPEALAAIVAELTGVPA